MKNKNRKQSQVVSNINYNKKGSKNSNKKQQKKPNGFIRFLRSLCTSSSQNECKKKSPHKKALPLIHKRLTFQLDRVLVKISRKNIVDQQFMQNQLLTQNLQKYLSYRLNCCNIVLVDGQFSKYFKQQIPYCLQIKVKEKQIMYENYTEKSYYEVQKMQNLLYINKNKLLKLNNVGTLVYQLYYGQKHQQQMTQDKTTANTTKKHQSFQQNYYKTQSFGNKKYDIKQQIAYNKSDKIQIKKQTKSDKIYQITPQSNIDRISQILKFYYKNQKTQNFIFICHKDLLLQQIHKLFLVFKEYYMFEFERVKKIDKIFCNIIYVSFNAKFLRIDNIALSQFLTSEMQKLKIFQCQQITSEFKYYQTNQQNKNIKQTFQINQDKQKCINELQKSIKMVQKNHKGKFQSFIRKILQLDLHMSVCITLGQVFDNSDKKANIILSWFLDLLYERCPSARQIIQDYQKQIKLQNQSDFWKSISQFTPGFEQLKFSKAFSKATALFKIYDQGQTYFQEDENKKISQDK